MARGRRCCCCKNFYSSQGIDLVKIDGNQGKVVPATLAAIQAGPLFVFDFVNKEIFARSGFDLKTIIRANDTLNTLVANVFTTAFTIASIAVHPQSEKVIYNYATGGTTSIKTVGYDGTGDTTIISFPTETTSSLTVTLDGYLYYNRRNTGPNTDGISRIKLDGTDDTVIVVDVLAPTGSITRSFDFDNVNKYLYVDIGFTKIYRYNADGTGPTLILDRSTAAGVTLPTTSGNNYAIAIVGWSHSYERLFFFLFNLSAETSPGLGLYSMKFDGSDVKAEIINPNFVQASTGVQNITTPGSNRFYLGCGLERTGGATKGS